MRKLWPANDQLDDEQLIALYDTRDQASPTLRVNVVTSLDGAATLDGLTEGLSNPADKRVFDILRMVSDVLLVGAGTLRNEGYLDLRLDQRCTAWRVAHGLPEHPVLAVVSGRLDLDPDQDAFARAPVRPLVLTHDRSPAARRKSLSRTADVLVCGVEEVDITTMLGLLHGRGLRHVLCEGGPQLFGAIAAADRVDELCLTISPLLTGGSAGRVATGPAMPARGMRLRHALTEDDMLLLRYVRCYPVRPATTAGGRE